jgi:hypothetical protein
MSKPVKETLAIVSMIALAVAVTFALFATSGCVGPGGGLPYNFAAQVEGDGTVGTDGGNLVAVVDGKATAGIYNANTDVPVVLHGEIMHWTIEGQKVVIRHLVEPKTEIELALDERVPLEFQAYIIGTIPPAMLKELQAQGKLIFEALP